MLTFQSYCWDASKRTCPSHDHSLHSVPCQSVAQSSENCRSECEEELWRCAAGTVLSLSTPACGHLRAPLLYTARSAGDASQDLPPYWPASQLSLMHLNALVFFLLCCCCGRRGAGWWGGGSPPDLQVLRTSLLSLPHNEADRGVPKTFPYEGTPTPAHTG